MRVKKLDYAQVEYICEQLSMMIGSGIGAGLAFILAATLICKGLHIISQNQDMPKAFRRRKGRAAFSGRTQHREISGVCCGYDNRGRDER